MNRMPSQQRRPWQTQKRDEPLEANSSRNTRLLLPYAKSAALCEALQLVRPGLIRLWFALDLLRFRFPSAGGLVSAVSGSHLFASSGAADDDIVPNHNATHRNNSRVTC